MQNTLSNVLHYEADSAYAEHAHQSASQGKPCKLPHARDLHTFLVTVQIKYRLAHPDNRHFHGDVAKEVLLVQTALKAELDGLLDCDSPFPIRDWPLKITEYPVPAPDSESDLE